jgi:hypothetical protein
MRYLAVVALVIAGWVAAPVALAQTSAPAPTVAPETTAPQPVNPVPLVRTHAPAQESAQAPAPTAPTNNGISSTAIVLLVVGGVILLLIIFAVAYQPWNRPGPPGPPPP